MTDTRHGLQAGSKELVLSAISNRDLRGRPHELQLNTIQESRPFVTPPILTTKLFVPPLRADLLRRPHLVEQLNQGASPRLTHIPVSAFLINISA